MRMKALCITSCGQCRHQHLENRIEKVDDVDKFLSDNPNQVVRITRDTPAGQIHKTTLVERAVCILTAAIIPNPSEIPEFCPLPDVPEGK